MFDDRSSWSVPAVLAVVFVVAAACAAPQDGGQEPAPLTEEAKTAIRETGPTFTDAVRAGDWDRLAGLYTEDTVLMPPGAATIEGRAAVREFWASGPAVDSVSITYDEIEGRGDLAYVRGRYFVRTQAESGDNASMTESRGKFVEIRERQPDGSWPLAVDIWNATPDGADSGASSGGE